MKIALVKQDLYDDLYVCPNRTPVDEMFLSTLMRTGPLGLFDKEIDADYFIIKEQPDIDGGLIGGASCIILTAAFFIYVLIYRHIFKEFFLFHQQEHRILLRHLLQAD